MSIDIPPMVTKAPIGDTHSVSDLIPCIFSSPGMNEIILDGRSRWKRVTDLLFVCFPTFQFTMVSRSRQCRTTLVGFTICQHWSTVRRPRAPPDCRVTLTGSVILGNQISLKGSPLQGPGVPYRPPRSFQLVMLHAQGIACYGKATLQCTSAARRGARCRSRCRCER